MKTYPCLLLLAAFSVFIFNGCTKDDNENDTPKTKTELLTAHPWRYFEYFRNYNSSSTSVHYKRGKTNNLINLDNNLVTYRTDGTYTEVNETGQTLNGTWRFLNNETVVEVVNSMGTFSSTIMKLDEEEYYWYSSTLSNGTYGKQYK